MCNKRGIIFCQYDFRPGDFGNRVFAEILHHSFDFFCTRLSFTHDRNTLFLRKSVFDIYVLQQFIHRLTVIFRPCRYLGHHGTRRHGVFITNEIFYQEAVTFFSAADILTFTLKLPHYGSNPFKSGVHIEALYSVTIVFTIYAPSRMRPVALYCEIR